MLVRCLYASRMEAPRTPKMWRDILAASRKNNPALGITGVLFTAEDCFIQVLEGGREQVCTLYNQIAHDPRHNQVTILVFEEIAQRSFEGWSMGEVHVKQINPAMLLKYSATATIDPFSLSGGAAMALLNDLVATGAVACGNTNRSRRG